MNAPFQSRLAVIGGLAAVLLAAGCAPQQPQGRPCVPVPTGYVLARDGGNKFEPDVVACPQPPVLAPVVPPAGPGTGVPGVPGGTPPSPPSAPDPVRQDASVVRDPETGLQTVTEAFQENPDGTTEVARIDRDPVTGAASVSASSGALSSPEL